MATVLALSSSVARGHVGLQALVPVMHRLGHEVIALPTVQLSNHPGHKASAGFRVGADALSEMLDALDANGWLPNVEAVVTGYLPSPQHVAFAAKMIERVAAARGKRPLYFCDPVLGDLPHGLYIDVEAAQGIRDRLVPLADVLTPNAFELGWLSGVGLLHTPEEAVTAARGLPTPHILATSVPHEAGLANVLVSPGEAFVCHVPLRERVPHGTGDVLTAQIAARAMALVAARGLGAALTAKLGEAVAATAIMIDSSAGSDELNLIATASAWQAPEPLKVTLL